jgi:hypothetical protein
MVVSQPVPSSAKKRPAVSAVACRSQGIAERPRIVSKHPTYLSTHLV